MPRLPSVLSRKLQDEVVSAYDRLDLKQLLFYNLEQELDEVVPADRSLSDTVFELIRWADRTGKLPALIRAIRQTRPDRETTIAVCDEVDAWLRAVVGARKAETGQSDRPGSANSTSVAPSATNPDGPDQSPDSVAWAKIAGFGLLLVAVLFLMAVIVFPAQIECNKRELVVFVLALTSAGAAGFLTADAKASGALTIPATPLRLAVSGGLATLIIVAVLGHYFYGADSNCGEHTKYLADDQRPERPPAMQVIPRRDGTSDYVYRYGGKGEGECPKVTAPDRPSADS